MSEALARMELTAAQGHIIGFLAHQPQAPCFRDIEERLQLSHPTVSGLLTRLEKKGFVELRPDPVDRRCKRVYLLPKSRECLAVMDGTIRGIEERLVQDFSPAEREKFSSLLNRAIINMGGNACRPYPKEE